MAGEGQAMIRGLPDFPDITEVNVRSGPGTNQTLIFKGPVGMSGLRILDVQPDVEGNQLNEKVYQWFRLVFHGGAVGWVRDDLLEIEGDMRFWGYPALIARTFAHSLVRHAGQAEPVEEPAHTPEPVLDADRIRKAAFLVTSAFEGQGYASFFNGDRAIISYGFLQFSLAAGSLATVVQLYLGKSGSDTANRMRVYLPRVLQRDPLLRHDGNFRSLLVAAAAESAMQQAQDEVATTGYWHRVVDGYISPRGLKLPLSWALLFDMGVNFGTSHGFVRLAEEQLGVLPRSRPGENGITEEQLITRVAQLRKDSHDRQALRENLPGLSVRGDFWVDRINKADWAFKGDSQGQLVVLGRRLTL